MLAPRLAGVHRLVRAREPAIPDCRKLLHWSRPRSVLKLLPISQIVSEVFPVRSTLFSLFPTTKPICRPFCGQNGDAPPSDPAMACNLVSLNARIQRRGCWSAPMALNTMRCPSGEGIAILIDRIAGLSVSAKSKPTAVCAGSSPAIMPRSNDGERDQQQGRHPGQQPRPTASPFRLPWYSRGCLVLRSRFQRSIRARPSDL